MRACVHVHEYMSDVQRLHWVSSSILSRLMFFSKAETHCLNGDLEFGYPAGLRVLRTLL